MLNPKTNIPQIGKIFGRHEHAIAKSVPANNHLDVFGLKLLPLVGSKRIIDENKLSQDITPP